MDRVQLVKQETAALGGNASDTAPWDAPIEPQEDAIEAAGVYLQDAVNRDEQVLVSRSGDHLTFKDVLNPAGFTLSALSTGGSGISEASHKALRQLIHFIDGGPAEGFASGAFRETTGTVFPSAIIWWTSAAKTHKIVEKNLVYSGAFPTSIEWKVYATDGVTVLATVTDAITYSGAFETSRTRTIA